MRTTMRKSLALGASLGVAALTMGVAAPATAAQAEHSYHATLDPINDSGASGMVTITMNGDQATVSLHATGLPQTFKDAPYPHAQHIHISGQGVCPDPSADKNGDGIVSTVEGVPAYGKVGTSLTTSGDTSANSAVAVKRFPGGSSYDYTRTFTLNSDTAQSLQDGTGVVVVHGLNPANLSEEAANAKSKLDPSLPLAATAPALCGELTMMPAGGADTGSGSTTGVEDLGWYVAGGGMLVGGAWLLSRRKRSTAHLN